MVQTLQVLGFRAMFEHQISDFKKGANSGNSGPSGGIHPQIRPQKNSSGPPQRTMTPQPSPASPPSGGQRPGSVYLPPRIRAFKIKF